MAAAASRSPPSLLFHSSPPCHVRTPYSSSCCFHSGPQTSLIKLSTSSRAARITRWPRLSRIGFKVVRSAATITCGGVVPEINESQFSDAVLKSDRPVLVEFVASWCGPCRLISPAMESIAQEYGDKLTVVKIDHDLNPRLIEEYKVYGLPTLIFFKNGQEIPESRREGAITKTKLQEYVDSLLQSMSVA